MSKKVITIEILSPEEISVSVDSPLEFEEALISVGNVYLHFLRSFLNTAPAEHQETAKQQMYDFANNNFSSLLELFAPEFELRPGLTEEALMRFENEALLSKMSQ